MDWQMVVVVALLVVAAVVAGIWGPEGLWMGFAGTATGLLVRKGAVGAGAKVAPLIVAIGLAGALIGCGSAQPVHTACRVRTVACEACEQVCEAGERLCDAALEDEADPVPPSGGDIFAE